MPGKCVFNELWLTERKYKDWIQRCDTDSHRAWCKLCKKSFDIGNMGSSAIDSHMQGQKHTKLLNATNEVLKQNQITLPEMLPAARDTAPSASGNKPIAKAPTSSQSTLDSSVCRDDKLRAEILWAMKCTQSHYSYNSCTDVKELFQKMFPDSIIAQQFTCGERKCAYICYFGLAPHFKAYLLQQVRQEENHVLLFDESLNKVTKTKQMDIHVRFWNDNQIYTRYYGSVFLGHATADDMIDKFLDYIKLDFGRTLQVSMDGPNVNWKFFELLQAEIFKDTETKLLNIGSCGLHIVHRAFQHACKKVDWNMESVLSSCYWLFKDTPARREDYSKATDSSEFPYKFCSHRWLENVSCAERVLKIWNNIKIYIGKVQKKEFSNPKTKSYETLLAASKDPLFLCKLSFFITLAKVVTPFLQKYQTDKPMIPYLATDMRLMLKDLLSRFIKKDRVPRSSITEMTHLDLHDKDIQLNYKMIDIGFSADRILKEQLVIKKVSESDVLQFRMDCKEQLIVLIEKLLEKAPIKHSVVRNLSCLNPCEMIENPEDCCKKVKRVLATLVAAKKLQEQNCDNIVREYQAFLEDIVTVPCHKKEFLECDRIDTLLCSMMKGKQEYRHLFRFVRQVLILSHGQATVERGFSINREVEEDNMKECSFVGRRLIVDHIQSVGGVLNVNINKSLLLSVAGARQKYEGYLEDQRQINLSDRKKLKRKSLLDEIEELKNKKKRLLDDQLSLTSGADEFANKAEKHGKLTFISKSNSLRRSAKEKEAEVALTDAEIEVKLKELKDK